MLTLPRLVRTLRSQDAKRLLQGLEAAGLPVGDALRPALLDRPTALLALGLRRATELAYGPSPDLLTLTEALLDRQRPDGGFGTHRGDLLTTAAAHAALIRLAGVLDGPARDAVRDADQRAVSRLREGLPGRLDALTPDDAASLAMIAYLLGDDTDVLREAFTPDRIATLEAACRDRRDLDALWPMARLGLEPLDPWTTRPAAPQRSVATAV